MSKWVVYIVRCADGSLYTGITTDIEGRIASHNRGTGAKYTRSFRPVKLIYSETARTDRAARKREAEIKRMNKANKEALVADIKTTSRRRRKALPK